MTNTFTDGEKVLIKCIDKTGTILGEETWMHTIWVDYDNEYGGKFWFVADLKLIEEDEL